MQRAVLIVGTAWVILGIMPVPAAAQQLLGDDVARASMAETAAAQRIPTVEPSSQDTSHRVLVPLYISAAALQMMDVHSTRRALAAGHSESNPMMSGIASNTAAFVAVKAATAATTIWLSEKLRKRNRVAAIGLMIAVNAATATVVAHNYRAVR